jgi:cell division cycle 20-like protein 1 (cofactor of APC complex)
VLDAPGLLDDFYMNVLDWGSSNLMAVGLSGDLYVWNGGTAAVAKITGYPDGVNICAVKWAGRGQHLAVATSAGVVDVWDVPARKVVRSYSNHVGKVNALAWADQSLASAGRDFTIHIRDARTKGESYATLLGHKHEVCGLAWSPEHSYLASGGNDNRVCVWDAAMTRPVPASLRATSMSPDGVAQSTPLWRFADFNAAAKALAWSPSERHLLAAGGGTHDRRIRFYAADTGELRGAVDTGAQVTQLIWSHDGSELASSHGFSQNSLVVWRYPSMSRIATLTGHNARVLYMAMAPDGQVIVTGAGDETLRFWSAFQPPAREDGSRPPPSSSPLAAGALDERLITSDALLVPDTPADAPEAAHDVTATPGRRGRNRLLPAGITAASNAHAAGFGVGSPGTAGGGGASSPWADLGVR